MGAPRIYLQEVIALVSGVFEVKCDEVRSDEVRSDHLGIRDFQS